MICTKALGPDEPQPAWLGAACADCGHSTLTHPGPANPALDACLVCELLAQLDATRQRLDKHDNELAVVPELPAEVEQLRGRVDELEARP